MTAAVLDKLRAERDEARDLAINMAEADDFDPASPDFAELQSRAEALDGRIDTLTKALEARESAKRMDARIVGAVESRSTAAERRTTDDQSIGEMFVRSEQFTAYNYRGNMAPVELPMLETRALPLKESDLTSSGASPWGRQLRFLDFDQQILTPIQDLATIIPVTGNSIDVVTLDYKTPPGQADVVPEGTEKPSTEFVPKTVAATLDLIATWTQFTRQLAEDAPAVRAAIERKLVRSVLLKLESEAAEVVTGGTYGSATGADLMAGIRVGMGQLQASGYSPNAVLLNPADWAALDVAISSAQTLGLPGVVQDRYWGLRVAAVPGLAEGTALVADVSMAFEVYRRTAVQTFITDSHADTFISNVFTLLAEARQKTIITDPGAVRKVTVSAGSGGTGN